MAKKECPRCGVFNDEKAEKCVGCLTPLATHEKVESYDQNFEVISQWLEDVV